MSDIVNTDNISINLNSSIETPKRGRGRPAKYTKEEREQKYKEASKIWKQEHREQCNEHHRVYYREHWEEVGKANTDYQNRARHALKLLSELIDNGQIEIKDEKYKLSITELIKNKKIITI